MRAAVFLFSLLAAAAAFPQEDVGRVSFANSGAAAAQESFLRGMALLHNFEYPSAAEAFRAAQEVDPSFAMAYWGEAMTHTHPIWFQQNAEAARAILQRLGATEPERLAKAGTDRERDYLRAVGVLYGEGSKEERDFLYADAMARIHERHPDDVDATAFYALAILGTSHKGRDIATYMRAAALLEEVFPANRSHPGVLHYMIHSYDDPIHAPLGMRAARLYGAVAPNAGHALHMTSHIFVAMGMWNDVLDANRRAIAVVNRQRAARSKPPADCGHYPEWLHYGLLQVGQRDEARAMLDACRASALQADFQPAGPMDSRHGRLGSYAEMRAQLLASGGKLVAADAVSAPDGTDFGDARRMIAYGDVLAAAQRGDVPALKRAVELLRAVEHTGHQAMQHDMPMNPSERLRTEVMVQEADALLLLATGKRDDGLALLKRAAQTEATMPFEFGPPFVPKPASELLAEQMLAAGRSAEAAAAYRSTLERAPGRTVAVEGLQRAQKRVE